MDTARCTITDTIYDALSFSKLPPIELSEKRRCLVCPECQGAAFFRKASRGGQLAFFAARHAADCPLKNKEHLLESFPIVNQSLDGFLESSLDDLESSALIKVSLREDGEDGEEGEEGEGSRSSGDAIKYLTLRAVLIKLIQSEGFQKSHQRIKVDDHLDEVSGFFVNFNEARYVEEQELHGFWGMLSDARFSSDGSLWLNSGGRDDVSCVIPSSTVDVFYERYLLEDEEELAGAFVVAIGVKSKSSSGKDFIEIKNISGIEVLRVTLDEDIKSRFFITEKKRIAFLLTHNEKGAFDKELGIKSKHYVDAEVAKAWRAGLAKDFHPDKNRGDPSIDYDEVFSWINKIYSRMVGKA